jgi:hypothetical protein
MAAQQQRAVGMTSDAHWQKEEIADPSALRALAEEARAAFPDTNTTHDIEWVSVAHDWPKNSLLVLSSRVGGKLVGIVPLAMSKAPLTYSFGPITFLKPKVTHYKFEQYLTAKHADRAQSIGACFETLFRTMPGGSVVFAGAVPIGSELHRQFLDAASPLRRRFHALAWGGESVHCRTLWEGSLDKYLASIGKKSGKELQRNTKALMNDPALKCEVRRFQTPEEIEVFFRDGAKLSDKTWQKQDFGQGIAFGGAVERVIRFAAARGSFYGYILYINDAPAAFRYGFKHGNTITMMQIGHDPVWSDRQIGSVMFFEVMRDFDKIQLPVKWLDFTPAVSLFKLRTTNDRRKIRHYYLFKRTPLGTLQYLTLKATDWLSRTIGSRLKKRQEGELEKYLARADLTTSASPDEHP